MRSQLTSFVSSGKHFRSMDKLALPPVFQVHEQLLLYRQISRETRLLAQLSIPSSSFRLSFHTNYLGVFAGPYMLQSFASAKLRR